MYFPQLAVDVNYPEKL